MTFKIKNRWNFHFFCHAVFLWPSGNPFVCVCCCCFLKESSPTCFIPAGNLVMYLGLNCLWLDINLFIPIWDDEFLQDQVAGPIGQNHLMIPRFLDCCFCGAFRFGFSHFTSKNQHVDFVGGSFFVQCFLGRFSIGFGICRLRLGPMISPDRAGLRMAGNVSCMLKSLMATFFQRHGIHGFTFDFHVGSCLLW